LRCIIDQGDNEAQKNKRLEWANTMLQERKAIPPYEKKKKKNYPFDYRPTVMLSPHL
jgi:hypothetical protein